MNRDIVILDTEKLDWETVQRGRVNMIRRKRLPLHTSVPGLTIEYSLSVVPEGYFTPRHRHNFRPDPLHSHRSAIDRTRRSRAGRMRLLP